MLEIGVQLSVGGASLSEILATAREYEQAGIGSIWIGDHLMDFYEPSRPVPECFVTLAAIAAVTSNVRLGSMIANVQLRSAALLAKMAATLLELSTSRFELGLGTGGVRAEHSAYGLPFPRLAERTRRLRDCLAVLEALRQPGAVTASGPGTSLAGAVCQPPLNGLRVIVGSLGPASARLAGRLADEINVIDYRSGFATPQALFAQARAEATRRGRHISCSLLVPAGAEPLGDGPRPDAGPERAEALGATRLVYRLLPPYPAARELRRAHGLDNR